MSCTPKSMGDGIQGNKHTASQSQIRLAFQRPHCLLLGYGCSCVSAAPYRSLFSNSTTGTTTLAENWACTWLGAQLWPALAQGQQAFPRGFGGTLSMTASVPFSETVLGNRHMWPNTRRPEEAARASRTLPWKSFRFQFQTTHTCTVNKCSGGYWSTTFMLRPKALLSSALSVPSPTCLLKNYSTVWTFRRRLRWLSYWNVHMLQRGEDLGSILI